jgi:hypothetical protein
MIRILIIDDAQKPDFIDAMCREISDARNGIPVEPMHLNPVNLMGNSRPRGDLEALLNKIAESAQEFWDVVIIDINLAEVDLPEDKRLHLSLSIAEKVRETNRAATVILYSGTLSDHVDKLLNGEMPAEAALKRIFRGDISAFVPRRRIEAEVSIALENPSWLLRIDRLLMRHQSLVVCPQEAQFNGRQFLDLAKAVRRQDSDGQRIAEIAAEYGIAAFADLNS